MKLLFNNVLHVKIYIILFLTVSCSTKTSNNKLNLQGDFELVTNDIQSIHQMEVRDESVVIASESGLFRVNKTMEPTIKSYFNSLLEVYDFALINDQEVLASVSFTDEDSTNILKSVNGGTTWSSFRNGFGGEFERVPFLMDSQIQNPEVIYAIESGLTVAKTINAGADWELSFGEWGAFSTSKFLKISSVNNSQIWVGGANAFFNPVLFRSNDDGETWDYIKVVENVEAEILDLIINEAEKKQIIVSVSGSIYKSLNEGVSWELERLDNIAIFSFNKSAVNENIIYASGINQNGTLFFTASNNFGDSWQTIEFEEGPSGIQVNDMISVMQDGNEVLYFGTNKGLYSFTID